MAAAESLDLRIRAGTGEATTLPAGLPDPPAAARTGDPFADAMALAAAQGGPGGTGSAATRRCVRYAALLHCLNGSSRVPATELMNARSDVMHMVRGIPHSHKAFTESLVPRVQHPTAYNATCIPRYWTARSVLRLSLQSSIIMYAALACMLAPL